jgi:hypothetical protein
VRLSTHRANLHKACFALSFIVGMPRGRFSRLPGFSIYTRRIGNALSSNLTFCLSVTTTYLSTPGVF